MFAKFAIAAATAAFIALAAGSPANAQTAGKYSLSNTSATVTPQRAPVAAPVPAPTVHRVPVTQPVVVARPAATVLPPPAAPVRAAPPVPAPPVQPVTR